MKGEEERSRGEEEVHEVRASMTWPFRLPGMDVISRWNRQSSVSCLFFFMVHSQ